MKRKLFYFLVPCFIIIFINNGIYAYSTEKTNEETGYQLLIEDDADLLSNDEIEMLEEDMMPLTEYGNIVFKSTEQSNSTSNYAHDVYYNKYGTASGSLFLFDMYNRMIYIYSDGENLKTITNKKADIITDNVYQYASDKNYYMTASEAFGQMKTLLDGGKIMEPMRYTSNIMIALVSAFLLNFVLIMRHSNIKKAKDEEILKNCKITFITKNTTAKQTGTHRVYSPISDGGSSSGFSSGGHSSGGGGHSSHSSHSSGGGGGHRF